MLQKLPGEALLRGFGAPVAKSEALLSLSVQPLAFRRSAVVLLGAGALSAVVEPSRQTAVVP